MTGNKPARPLPPARRLKRSRRATIGAELRRRIVAAVRRFRQRANNYGRAEGNDDR